MPRSRQPSPVRYNKKVPTRTSKHVQAETFPPTFLPAPISTSYITCMHIEGNIHTCSLCRYKATRAHTRVKIHKTSRQACASFPRARTSVHSIQQHAARKDGHLHRGKENMRIYSCVDLQNLAPICREIAEGGTGVYYFTLSVMAQRREALMCLVVGHMSICM